jgi:O-antigen/teichoic acid export membrane protein
MQADAKSIGSRAIIARNAGWNLLGALLPIPVAIVCIPPLVASLGVERFGILGIAWMVLGYFGMFDFGLAQSTTRALAAGVARGERGALRALAMRSLVLHGLLGLVGGTLFALLVPWLAGQAFKLPSALVPESARALYWLAVSVPAIVVTAAFRGVLEGLQRFHVINMIRIPASVVNYAGPLVAIYFGTSLALIVSVIVIGRYAFLCAYAYAAMRALPVRERGVAAGPGLIELAVYGGWLTVSNLLTPLIIATDRFVLASAVSVAAVTFYVTPYEVITKGWIVSASLMGALFPVFSGLAEREPASIRALCRSAERLLLALATPAIVLLLGIGDLLLEWWLGTEFRDRSTTVAQLLGLGLLVNIVAQVPLTALNAMGRADLSAKLAALELPLYVGAISLAAVRYGIVGVAAIWALRALADAFALFTIARFVLPADTHSPSRLLSARASAELCAFLAAAGFIARTLPDASGTRLALIGILLVALIAWQWRVLLASTERETFTFLWRRLLKSSR